MKKMTSDLSRTCTSSSTRTASRITFLIASLFATLLAAALPAAAQSDWPSKAVVFIVPFPAGGGTDAFARPLSALLNKQLGRQIIIDNRGGAGGTLGAGIAARATADGYTFLIGAVHHAIAPSVYSKLDYDLEKDLVPVTSLAHVPQVIVVNPSRVTAGNLKELIAAVQKQPGKLTFGSAGNGTSHHLAGEMFKMLTKSDVLHVPYKGAGPALTDLIAGQIDMMFDGLGSSAGHIKGGKIRALAVASRTRAPGFADVPTTVESGVPGFVMSTWYGIWGPKGLPSGYVDRMQKEVNTALNTKELKDIWMSQGSTAGGESPAEFAKFIRAEVERFAKVAQESGAKVE